MHIKKVYETYDEMIRMYPYDKWKNGSVVMVCPEHGEEHAKQLFIVATEGYEGIPKYQHVKKVYRNYDEMVEMYKYDKWPNTSIVLVSPDHGGSRAGDLFIVTPAGYAHYGNVNDGGGGAVDTDPYEGLPPTRQHFDGLPAGSNINGQTVKEVVKKILYPYAPPKITMSTIPNVSIQEKGTAINEITITANITKQSYPIMRVRFFIGTKMVHELTTGVADGGTFTFKSTERISADTVIKVEAYDDNETAAAQKSIVYVNRAYYGVVPAGTVLDVPTIKGLANNELKTSKALRWQKITGVNCHIVYAYPASQGDISSIIDGMNLQCITSYTKTREMINGEIYNVYKLTDPASITDVLQNFT